MKEHCVTVRSCRSGSTRPRTVCYLKSKILVETAT